MADFESVTLFEVRSNGGDINEPEPMYCEFCGEELDRGGVRVGGSFIWPTTIACGCAGAKEAERAKEAEQERRKMEDADRRRSRAIEKCGIPRRYADAKVAGKPFVDYITSFAGSRGAGLYIHGGVGRGKTHSAAALAIAFLDAEYKVTFATAKGMLENIKASFDSDGSTSAAIGRYSKCDLLFLDDLGKEEATEWSAGMVFAILDQRYEDMRPTIITSNYTLPALRKRLARRGEATTAEAIVSRIGQTCRVVELAGPDRRVPAKVQIP